MRGERQQRRWDGLDVARSVGLLAAAGSSCFGDGFSSVVGRLAFDGACFGGLASTGLLQRGLQPTKKKTINRRWRDSNGRGFRMAWLALRGCIRAATDNSTINQKKSQLDDVRSLPVPSLSRPRTPVIKEGQEQTRKQRRSTRQPATNNDKQTVARRTGNNQPRIKKQTINLPFFFWLSSHLTGPPRLLRFWAVTGEMGEKTSVFPPTNKPPNPAQHGTLGLINLRSQRFDKCPKNYFVSLK